MTTQNQFWVLGFGFPVFGVSEIIQTLLLYAKNNQQEHKMILRYACFIVGSIVVFFRTLIHATKPFGSNAFTIETEQGRFLLPNSDGTIAYYLKRFGQWEYSSVMLVADILAQYDNGESEAKNVILDIGANLGTWSIPLSRLPGAKVYSFEPQRYMMQHLRASLLLNGVTNVVPVYSAISNVTGHILINDVPVSSEFSQTVDGDNGINFGGLSLLAGLTDKSVYGNVPSSMVPTVTLDGFRLGVLKGACPRFLKLDIELYEVYAFMGARQMLRECKPIIFMESHCMALNKPMFLMLHSLGYELFWVVIPALDDALLKQVGIRLNIDHMRNWTDIEFNKFYFGSLNVLALPKTFVSPKTGKSITASQAAKPFINKSLYPVKIGNGTVDIDVGEAGVKYCVSGVNATDVSRTVLRCGFYTFFSVQDSDSYEAGKGFGDVANDCTIGRVDSFLLGYWRNYEHVLKQP